MQLQCNVTIMLSLLTATEKTLNAAHISTR